VLLAETVEAAANARVLLLGCGHGALAVALARALSAGEILLTDVNIIALTMAEQTLRANNVTNARIHQAVSVLPEQADAFDIVVLVAPKGRKLARRWLVEAFDALKLNGRLYLAGPNDEGIQSLIADAAALFGSCALLTYKRRNRVAVAHKGSAPVERPAWVFEPGIAPGTWHKFSAQVGDTTYPLRSLPGVFAYDSVDDGTRLLLEKVAIEPDTRVLDFGCGHGIIGLAAVRAGAQQVDMLDVDLLAVASAQANIEHHNATNARVLPSDGLQAARGQTYDLVISNPPFHTGKDVDFDVSQAFIEEGRSVLAPGGQLALVANAFIRHERLLRQFFSHVECIAENNRYRVLVASHTGA
jgi:16S rRNA (guanine1207-N2)-methyltransferase